MNNKSEIKDIFNDMRSLFEDFSKLTIRLEIALTGIQPNDKPQGKEIITVKDCAKYLKCSESFIREAARMKGLPHSRIGTKILIDKAEVNKWVKDNKIH